MTITPDDERPVDPYGELVDEVPEASEENEAPEPSDADGRPVPLLEDE
jgi:hypothetical protein